PERIVEDWPASTFASLEPAHFAALAGLDREIILLGTGDKLRFPRPEVIAPLLAAGIGVEVMDLQAACRTYNILVAEGPTVAAAPLIECRGAHTSRCSPSSPSPGSAPWAPGT